MTTGIVLTSVPVAAANLLNANLTPVYAAGAWTFKNASAVTTLTGDANGAWTIGPTGFATETPADNIDRHLIRGNIAVTAREAYYYFDSTDSYPAGLELRGNGTGSNGGCALYWRRSENVPGSTNEHSYAAIWAKTDTINNGCAQIGFYTSFADNAKPALRGYVSGIGVWVLGQSGGTTTQRSHTIYGGKTDASTPVLQLNNYYSAYNCDMLRFVVGGNSSGGINATGTGTAPVFYSGASDRTLKKNIEDVTTDFLGKVVQIRLRKFEMIDNPGEVCTGVIAQELQEVYPDHVKVRDDGKLTVSMGWDWDLIGAIQQLSKKLDEANAKIAALEAK